MGFIDPSLLETDDTDNVTCSICMQLLDTPMSPAGCQEGHTFCASCLRDALKAAVAQAPDRQRRVQGVPDAPLSLMEGDAGVLCFLLDLAAAAEPEAGGGDSGARPPVPAFPGWEL